MRRNFLILLLFLVSLDASARVATCKYQGAEVWIVSCAKGQCTEAFVVCPSKIEKKSRLTGAAADFVSPTHPVAELQQEHLKKIAAFAKVNLGDGVYQFQANRFCFDWLKAHRGWMTVPTSSLDENTEYIGRYWKTVPTFPTAPTSEAGKEWTKRSSKLYEDSCIARLKPLQLKAQNLKDEHEKWLRSDPELLKFGIRQRRAGE